MYGIHTVAENAAAGFAGALPGARECRRRLALLAQLFNHLRRKAWVNFPVPGDGLIDAAYRVAIPVMLCAAPPQTGQVPGCDFMVNIPQMRLQVGQRFALRNLFGAVVQAARISAGDRVVALPAGIRQGLGHGVSTGIGV